MSMSEAMFEPTSKKQLRPTVAVVIPTKNEALNLPHVLPQIPDMVDEVIIVDGHSSDNTVAVALELWPEAKIVYQTGKGKGNALRAGFAAASSDIIVMLDADGSTDPQEIPAYVGTLIAGADFAKGSRFMQGGGTSDMEFVRYLGNQAFVWMVRLFFGGTYTDLCYGYNAFWAWTLPLLDLDGDGFEIETMMNVRALQAGLAVAEIPSFEYERIHGKSNLQTWPDGWRVLMTIFKEWLKKPLLRALPKPAKASEAAHFNRQIRKLLGEALRLAQASHDEALLQLENSYLALLYQEVTCSRCYHIQQRYRKHYSHVISKLQGLA